LHQGDQIVYKIYGNSSITPTGGILGINYVKLTGTDTADYDLEFSSLEDMNAARFGLAYTNDGDHLYAICGQNYESPDFLSTMEKYDPLTNTWTEFVDNLTPRRWCRAEYIASNNNIYILGGLTGDEYALSDDVQIVNVNTGSVSNLTADHVLSSQPGTAIWNDKIYVFGGSLQGGCTNALYEFNPLTNTWIQLASMPESKETEGEIIDGILYIFGGYNGEVSNRIDAYNIQNNEWSFIGYMPEGISAHHTAVSGHYIWLIGCYENLNSVALYNTATGEFEQLSNNMIGRRHCGAQVVGNNLYVYGGNVATGGPALSSLQSVDIGYLFSSISEAWNQTILAKTSPNPFTTSTTLSYELKQPEKVTLSIFNHLGQLVYQTQLNQQPGNQQLIWNAEGYAEGVYYYRLKAGDQVANGKLVKVR
jgi:N-acetylneuraminic acid mutarotase